MNILFQLHSTPLNHLWAHQAAGSLQRQTQRKWRGYSGRSISEVFAKDWIIFWVYFCLERKPQASECWLPSPTPNFCKDKKSNFWNDTSGIWVGSNQDVSLWVAFVFVSYPGLLHPSMSFPPRDIVCSPHLLPIIPKHKSRFIFERRMTEGLSCIFVFLQL